MRNCGVFFGDVNAKERDLIVVYGDRYFTSRHEFLSFLIEDLKFTPQISKSILVRSFQRCLVTKPGIEEMLKMNCKLTDKIIASLVTLKDEVEDTPVKPKRTPKKKKEDPATETPQEKAPAKPARKRTSKKATGAPAEEKPKRRITRKKKTTE